MKSDSPYNPYVGPRPFEIADRGRFFGRDREIDELLAFVVAHPVVLFYAPSGAGKTSILNAGLIPQLEEEGFRVYPTARIHGEMKMNGSNSTIVNVFTYDVLTWMFPDIDPSYLKSLSLSEILQQQPHVVNEEGHRKHCILIIDQFEELFMSYQDHWPDRETFIKQIVHAQECDPSLRVLLSMREDFLASVDSLVHWIPGRLRARVRMERLQREAAMQAVSMPVRRTGRYFADGVVETLINDLRRTRVVNLAGETIEVIGEYIEPVQLQVVCRNLWENLPENVVEIRDEHTRKVGDVDQVILEFYEEVVRLTSEITGVPEHRIRKWCEQELITPMETRDILLREHSDTRSMPNIVIDELQTHHLIRSEQRSGARWYELSHDRFIEAIMRSARNRSEQTRRVRRRYKFVALIIMLPVVFIVALIMTTALVYPPRTIVPAQLNTPRPASLEKSSPHP